MIQKLTAEQVKSSHLPMTVFDVHYQYDDDGRPSYLVRPVVIHSMTTAPGASLPTVYARRLNGTYFNDVPGKFYVTKEAAENTIADEILRNPPATSADAGVPQLYASLKKAVVDLIADLDDLGFVTSDAVDGSDVDGAKCVATLRRHLSGLRVLTAAQA